MASAVVLVTVTVIVSGFFLHPSAGQLCGVDGKVRLTGGSSNREGRVEICMNGVWGEVCQWYIYGSENAQVVCRQLGYPVDTFNVPSYSTDHGGGDIVWLSSTFCSGTESSLLECSHDGPAFSCSGFAHVTCPSCTDGSVRLEGGLVPTEGNVQVCVNGEYVGVCRTNWDYKDAFVVCRQLGYPATDAQFYNSAYFGEDIIPKFYNVLCYGNESFLMDCQYTTTTCSNIDTAGVRCQGEKIIGTLCADRDVRLADSEDEHEGRVEICSNGVWGTVSNSGWDSRDATVVCRQLRHQSATGVFRSLEFGQGTGPVLFQNLNCDSSEPSLYECESDLNSYYSSHSTDVGVRCEQVDQTDCVEGAIRLAGGRNNTEGRIEICHNQIWGTICDYGWDSYDAETLCYQLGFRYDKAVAYSGAHFGEGSGPYHYSSFGCSGSESTILSCSHNTYYTCPPGRDAGVSCRVTQCNHGDVRLEDSYTDVEGRVEVCIHGQWGTVCDDNRDQSAFDLICRQYFDLNHAYSFSYGTFGSGGGRLMLENLQCTGSESKLTECQYSFNDFTGSCRISEDAGVRCYNESGCSHLDVRLMDGRNEFEGRVEVCQSGIWGAVRDYRWSYYDAVATCKQLGYPSNWVIPLHQSFFGRGNAPILVDEVYCNDDQNFTDCSYNTYSISSTVNYDVAGVICQGNTTSVPECTSGDIRLAGGSSEGEGRVEVCIDGFWGTVCSSKFEAEEAVVICRQMGYPSTGALVYSGDAFGPGQGPIMGQLTCTGGETNIDQCVFGGVGAVDCHHGIDAAMTCTAFGVYYEVTISKVPEDPVQIGNQVDLQCSVSPNPSSGEITQYRWTSSLPVYSITNSNSQNATVTILSGHPKNGNYYCHVYNGRNLLGVGHVTIEVQGLLVAVTSEMLQFTPPETVTLQVGVTDVPQQYYLYGLVWYHDGYKLTSSDRIQLSEDNMTLTITNTSEDDSGVYEVQYRGVHVRPVFYDTQCEEKVMSTLRHYPLLQPVKFYVDSGSGIISHESSLESVLMFTTTTHAVVPFTDLENITLAIEGTVELPILSDTLTVWWRLNGQSIPTSFHSGVLQIGSYHVSQTIELNELNLLNNGVLDAALVIGNHLGCPNEYSNLVRRTFGIYYFSQSSIGIQYSEPPVMTLEPKKLDLKKGERSTLTCTAAGGFPPVQNISLLKAGAVLVSTDSSSLSITAGSGLEYGYGHYACAVNSAGVIREEKAKIEEKADLVMQFKFEGNTSCGIWNEDNKERKAKEFADSFSLVAQARCSCDFSADNMHYSSAACSGGGNTFTVRFTVIYSDENGYTLASTVLDMMEQWAVTGPTLAIDGIQATVTDFSCSTCSDPGNNGGLIAGLLIGGIAIGCISVLIPITLLVIWKKIKQSIYESLNEESAPPSTTKAVTTNPQKAVSTSSQKAVTTNPQKTVSTSSQKAVTTNPQKTVSTSSRKAVTTNPQKAVSTSSRKAATTLPHKAVSTSSQKEATTNPRMAVSTLPVKSKTEHLETTPVRYAVAGAGSVNLVPHTGYELANKDTAPEEEEVLYEATDF